MNKVNDTTKNLVTGAVIGAGVAAAGAVLAHKPTRKKIIKGVRGALNEVQKRTQELGAEAKDQYEKTTKKVEETKKKLEDAAPKELKADNAKEPTHHTTSH